MSNRIIFINPPVDTTEYDWEYGLGSRLPPIGLCSLAASVRKYGFEVAILDAYNLGLSTQATVKKIMEFSPTHVGITASTSYVFFAAKLAKMIREDQHQIVTIIGGSHLSAMPHETMEKFPDFDIGVIGEGEETIVELLNLPPSLLGLDKVRGIIYRGQDGALKKTQPRPYLDDLDKLPYPAWDLLQGFPSYYRPSPTNYKRLPIASLVTSRGCPYQCTFCDRTVFGNRYRSFSADYIIGLVKELKYKYGVGEIAFYDDTFTVNGLRLDKICEYFIKNDLKLFWSCLGRVDLVDSKKLKLMKRAGCWLISYGIETASQKILDLYQKKISLLQIKEAIKITKDEGIHTRGFFMIGNPLETEDTIAQLRDLLRRMPLDDIHIGFFTPLPGSELYKSADKYGRFSRDWRAMDRYALNFIPKSLNKDLLLKYKSKLYRSFYLQPTKLLRYFILLFNPKRTLEILSRGLIFLKLIIIKEA